MEARPPDSDLRSLEGAGPEQRAQRLGEMLERHRERLLRLVELRMDPALRARLGASDVLQEAFLEAHERIDAYLVQPRMPFYLWLRFLTLQRLRKAWRFHAGAKRRDLRREQPVDASPAPTATAEALALHLAASGLSPSMAMARAEVHRRVLVTIERMSALDREILALRHFEELPNVEVAQVLGVSVDVASKRYLRALERLRAALGDDPEGDREADAAR